MFHVLFLVFERYTVLANSKTVGAPNLNNANLTLFTTIKRSCKLFTYFGSYFLNILFIERLIYETCIMFMIINLWRILGRIDIRSYAL